MPPDYTRDVFTIELDHLHDIQLLLQELVKLLGQSLETLPLKSPIT